MVALCDFPVQFFPKGAGIVGRFGEEGARVVFSDLLNEKGKGLEEELGKNAAFSARIAQKNQPGTHPLADTGVIQDGFIRRYSMALKEAYL